jgi:hypothetical protein
MLFDFRGHGESQYGPCAGCYTEDQDVAGAVEYAFKRVARETGGETPQVGGVGFGLGATAAISAIGRVRGDARAIRVFSADGTGASGFIEYQAEPVKLLRFLVAVEPASLGNAFGESLHGALAPLRRLYVPVVDMFCRAASGYPMSAELLLEFAGQVYTPALFVRGSRGESRADGVDPLYAAAPGPKELWTVDEPGDRLAVCEYVAAHMDRVLAFAHSGVDRLDVVGPAPFPAAGNHLPEAGNGRTTLM